MSGTALSWVALGTGLLALPGAPTAVRRARAMAARGRLARAPAVAPRHRAGRRRRAVTGRGLPTLGCAAFAATLSAMAGLPLAVAGGATAALACWLARSRLRRRADTLRRRELADGMRVLAAELDSGTRAVDALEAAGASASSYRTIFAEVADAARAGEQISAVLLAASRPELTPLGHGWRLAETCGLSLASAVTCVSADLAAHQQQQRAVSVALAGPRSSAALLAGLPLLGIGLGTMMGARPLEFLFTAPAGGLVCCVGTMLDLAGVLWTARLLRRAERL